MRHFISLLSIAFLLTLSSVAYGQQISDCASQEGCVFAATPTGVTVTRKGVLKGTIPIADITHMSIDEGYVIFRQENGVVGTRRIFDSIQCLMSPQPEGLSCRPGIIGFPGSLGESSIFTCAGFMWLMETDCSHGMNTPSSEMGNSITRNDTHGFFVMPNEDQFAWFEINSPGVEPWEIDFPGESTTGHALYDTMSDRVFMTGGNTLWEVSASISIPHQILVFPEVTKFAATAGNGKLIYAANTEMYIVEADIVSPTYVSVSLSAGPVAAAPGAAYVVDATNLLRAYDYDGNELSFSPVLDGTSIRAIAVAKPSRPAMCGNTLVEPGETCDGTDFDGEIVTCESLGFDGGTLTCSASTCDYDTSGCYTCGDGVMGGPETCDGTDFGTDTCLDQGFTGGDLSCSNECTLVLDTCFQCGNNVVEDVETCDGTDLDGNICQSLGLGFDGGTLACNLDCGGYDTNSCFSCGDGNIDASETCDGSNLGSETCESLGFGSGTLTCNGTCSFDTSGCSAAANCGDGTLDAGEECDDGGSNSDTNPNACRTNCTLPSCGDGVLDNLETCDDGNTVDGDGCDYTCKVEIETCGNGTIDATEVCDGTDLGGETCESLGFDTGVLYCNSNCTRNVSDCVINAQPQAASLNLYPEPDGQDFDSSTAEDYVANVSSLEPLCIRTVDTSGNVTMSTSDGAYCDFSIELLTKSGGLQRVFYHLYPTDTTPTATIANEGKVLFPTGGSIITYQSISTDLILGNDEYSAHPAMNDDDVLETNLQHEYWSTHPDTDEAGRWLAFYVPSGNMEYCQISSDKCVIILGRPGQKSYVNLDTDLDINDFKNVNIKNPDPGFWSCNTSFGGNKSSSRSMLFLFSFLGFAFVIMRKRKNL